MTFNNPSNSNNNDFQQTSGVFEFADRVRSGPGLVENIGISYSSPTFSITSADGTALSATNPGYVILQDATTPGQLKKYKITADQSFIDDSGSSEIIGNLFGFTTSIAITVDVPFFIYAVSNDAEDAIAFMINRIPGLSKSPITANIGAPDDAVAGGQNTFWSLENIDETLYDTNPCFCIGSFRMKMSASDDWTVQTLEISDDSGSSGITSSGFADGIGSYQQGRKFTVPLGQLGAGSGSWLYANGGTKPVFSAYTNNDYWFYGNLTRVRVYLYMSGDGGTDGSGANNILITCPFSGNGTFGIGPAQFATPTYLISAYVQVTASNARCNIYGIDGSAAVISPTNSLFSNGTRMIRAYYDYQI